MTDIIPFHYARHNIARPDRNRFCAKLIQERNFEGPILNVGSGGEEFLKKALVGVDITDIDMSGKVDVRVNLEKDIPLPFEDKSYATSVCLDVLEHIETFHAVFYELLRVTSGNVIISLPNCSATYFRNLLFNRQPFPDEREQFGKYEKYYGFPYDIPEDRHKWFFCFDEAIDFFMHHAENNGYVIDDVMMTGDGGFKHRVVNRLMPRLYRNLIPRAFWIILRMVE